MFKRAIYHSRDKCTLFLIKILIFIKNILKGNMTIFPVSCDLKQYIKHEFAPVYRCCHSSSSI